MQRDLRIVSEKEKAFYTLTLMNGTELNMLKPTLEYYYRILEMKKLEAKAETMEEAFKEGLSLLVDYLNTNVEKKKFKEADILKNFTLSNIQAIIGDMYNFAIGVDSEKN